MSTLSVEQSASLVNILGCICLGLSLFSLLGVFFGNSLIDSLKLDKRLPSLKKFLSLRMKFQRYYLILDFSIIAVVMLIMFSINILVLIG